MERSLRICLVAADYPRPESVSRGVGGIATHTSTLARALASLGHRVTVLTETEHAPDRYEDAEVEVVAVPAGSRRLWRLGRWVPVAWLRRSRRAARAIRRLHATRRFDVVDFPDGYGEGFHHSYRARPPFVVHLYGPASVVQRWDGRRIPPVRARLEERMERRPVSRAALVVCASRRFGAEMSAAWRFDPARVRIIRNPVDLTLFRPAPDGAENGAPVVLFVGHIQRLKGVETLVEAVPGVVRGHATAEFWFVGNDTRSAPGGGSMRAHLERMLAERGVSGPVRFLEPVPQRDLVALYRRCAVFVLPSLHDVFPNVVLEAMACGRPVVVTDTVGVAELIQSGETGFVVPPGHPESLAHHVSRLLAMAPARRSEIGRLARRVVVESCEASRVAGHTVEAYREAVRRPRALDYAEVGEAT